MSEPFQLREATEDDAEAILEVQMLIDLVEVGEPNSTIDQVRSGLANHNESSVVVEGADGKLLGFAWAAYTPGHAKAWGDVSPRPGAPADIDVPMLSWLRDSVRRIAPGRPAHVFADSKDERKKRLYESAGGEVIRHSFRMGVALRDAPDPVLLPERVEISTVEHDDALLRVVHALIDTAFRDHFGHEDESFEHWRDRMVGACPDPALWLLATVDGDPASALLGVALSREVGYVDTLGTLRAFRGKGLGRLLLLTAFQTFRDRGMAKATLYVDSLNPTGAVGLYESVGMRMEQDVPRYELPPLPIGS